MELPNRERGQRLLQNAALYLADEYEITGALAYLDPRYPIQSAVLLLFNLEVVVRYGREECLS